jgi:hypothetical protein
LNDGMREIRYADRTKKIFRFDPALSTADHATQQDFSLTLCQPRANFGA